MWFKIKFLTSEFGLEITSIAGSINPIPSVSNPAPIINKKIIIKNFFLN